MLNFVDIPPVTEGTMSYVHVKYCVLIPGSAAGLAVGLTLRREGTTSEHTGGTVVSEATVLHVPWGKSWGLHPAADYTTSMRLFKNLGLENETLGFRLEGRGDLWVSSLSRVLMLLKTPPTSVEWTVTLLAVVGPPQPHFPSLPGQVEQPHVESKKQNTKQHPIHLYQQMPKIH